MPCILPGRSAALPAAAEGEGRIAAFLQPRARSPCHNLAVLRRALGLWLYLLPALRAGGPSGRRRSDLCDESGRPKRRACGSGRLRSSSRSSCLSSSVRLQADQSRLPSTSLGPSKPDTTAVGLKPDTTSLIEAAAVGDAAAVRALIKKGVNVNAAGPDGATALHWAVRADDLASVEALIGAGAQSRRRTRSAWRHSTSPPPGQSRDAWPPPRRARGREYGRCDG